jgi:hypothetical protein
MSLLAGVVKVLDTLTGTAYDLLEVKDVDT